MGLLLNIPGEWLGMDSTRAAVVVIGPNETYYDHEPCDRCKRSPNGGWLEE